MRNILRVVLVAVVVIYLLDAGVEAGKSRKKRNKNRRSKKTHDARRRHKSRGDGEEEIQKIELEDDHSFIKLVEAQQNFKGHKVKVEKPAVEGEYYFSYGGVKSSLARKYIESQNNFIPPIDDGVTVLPVVHAKLEFLIKRENSPYFYEPTTTTTLNGFSAAELGLVTVHTANGKYGLHSSSEKIFGRLIHISDAGRSNSHFGCGNAISNINEIPTNQQPWIALIERGHCSFFTKIRLAERNNASAVIVYDNKAGEVLKMNTIGTRIVSAAISKHDGHKVARLADTGTEVLVNIVVNTNPDPATVPEVTTFRQPLERAVHQTDPDNGAKSNKGLIITTLLTAMLAVLLQSTTSS